MTRRLALFGLLFVPVALIAGSFKAGVFHFRKIDTSHSTIGFVVPILGGMSEVHGRFTDFEVDLEFDSEDVTRSKMRAVIRSTSLDTGIADRDTHLRSADFFDVENHPTIEFTSSAIEKVGDHYRARGTLKLRGVEKEIEIPFRVAGTHTSESGKTMVGLAGEFSLDRQKYGIAWRHPDPTFVGDEVRVILRVLTKLKSPEPDSREG